MLIQVMYKISAEQDCEYGMLMQRCSQVLLLWADNAGCFAGQMRMPPSTAGPYSMYYPNMPPDWPGTFFQQVEFPLKE
jgi:hypothetical protein